MSGVVSREKRSKYLVTPESDMQPEMSVVMPTLNEEEGIEKCIRRIQTAMEELEIYTEILISDSSTDRTPLIARSLGVKVVKPDKQGYGYAYRYAFARTRGEYVVMGDADATYDFESIPRLLYPVRSGDADICIGSRLEGTVKKGSMPLLHKYVGNPLLTRFLNIFYETDVSDAHSGFRVFSREALDKLELQSDGMEFASEIIMKAGAKGLEIAEVPIVYHEREGEETLESFRDGWRHVRFMLVNAPNYLFSYPAAGAITIGLFLITLSLGGVVFGGFIFGLSTLVGGVVSLLVGYQLLSLALFSSITGNPIQNPSNNLIWKVRQRFQLERVLVGSFFFSGLGLAYFGYVVSRSGTINTLSYSTVGELLLALTIVVISLQTVFNWFFVTLIDRQRPEPSGPDGL